MNANVMPLPVPDQSRPGQQAGTVAPNTEIHVSVGRRHEGGHTTASGSGNRTAKREKNQLHLLR